MIISPLKVWVQNILPVVYDDSLSYLEMVAKINAKTNEIISQTNENTNAIETLASVISDLGDIDELKALLDEVKTIVEDLYTTDAPLMDGVASAGSADHAARSDHVHPSDTGKANKDLDISNGTANQYVKILAVDDDGKPTSFGSDTPSGGTELSDSNPLMNGTASAGSGTKASREDHVHPSDTSKAPVNHASGQTTYGVGDANNYGHVKITDDINNTDSGTAVKASTVKTVNNKLSAFTKDNFLDNSNFQNPVNQRGLSSYTNADSYTIDRWKLISGSVTVVSSGITLNGTLVQILENAIGQATVCSALLSDGSMITPTYNDNTKTFTITATGQTIKAAKLELGAEQTLAHNEGTEESPVWVLNEIPNYDEELAKCQRYYFPFGNEYQCNCQYRGDNVFRALFPAYNIVKTPSINCNSSIWIVSEKGLTNCSVTSTSVSGLLSGGIIVDVTVSAAPVELSSWRNCILIVDSYFNFSADL